MEEKKRKLLKNAKKIRNKIPHFPTFFPFKKGV